MTPEKKKKQNALLGRLLISKAKHKKLPTRQSSINKSLRINHTRASK
jgi:hypothetical protein